MIRSIYDYSQYNCKYRGAIVTHHDIAIVGLGPVGSLAALLFAEAGLKVAIIELGDEVYPLPRAVNLDGEVIRAFQQSGRAEIVYELMQKFRPGDRAGFANADREWLFGQEFSDFGVNGWPSSNMFDQPEFEVYVRGEALSHKNVTSHLGCEVTKIENIDHQVALNYTHIDFTHVDSGTLEFLTATYALGCDGAASFVRKSLDIGWRDLGYDHAWLVVDVTIHENATLNNDTLQVCDPDRIVTYVCTKDPYRRWEFKLNPGETGEDMLKLETIQSLIDPWTPRDSYDIRRSAVYQFHAATAERWRVGNVFLAGDAAHQTPPFLGQGLNAGMRDVINLAWKFPMVISNLCGDGLLDTYYQERNAHAHDLVDWAVSIGKLMDHMAEVERAKRAGTKIPDAPSALQNSAYGQGREAPPLRAGIIYQEQLSDTGSTGYLFSQPIVADSTGKEYRLDHLLGNGFSVVATSSNALEMSEPSINFLQKIGAQQVALENLKVVRGHFDKLFDQSDAAIVRPDKIVFGHTTEEFNIDHLVEMLAMKLNLLYG